MQLDMASLSKIPLPETLLNLKDLKQRFYRAWKKYDKNKLSVFWNRC